MKTKNGDCLITLIDGIDPEDSAMLQALYSRSSASVHEHLRKLAEVGSGKFMKEYYIGYGHESIGDCGYTTIYIEGLSILAAKAVEDSPLFVGQETSTRYLDFSTQGVVDPVGTPESAALQQKLLALYRDSLQPTIDYLSSTYPLPEGADEKVWRKAIKARAFDILRGLLPAGVRTQVAWTTSLRHAAYKLKLLQFHPLEELQAISDTALHSLGFYYPNSFVQPEYYNQHEVEYLRRVGARLNYLDAPKPDLREGQFRYTALFDYDRLQKNELEIVATRPKGAKLPHHLLKYGLFNCEFLLDYGSVRDLQRHRNGVCQLPLLSTRYGFSKWYLEAMPEICRKATKDTLSELYLDVAKMTAAGVSEHDLQYYLPLGTNVSVEISYGLPEMVYVAELRSGPTVHPTLRRIAHSLAQVIQLECPSAALYVDFQPDEFCLKRGQQDIIKREPPV